MEYANDAAPEDVLTTDVDVYVVADFYAVPVLKKLIAAQFESHLAESWNPESFPQAVQTIYTDTPTTDRTLRDMALDAIMEHTADLFETGEGTCSTPLTEFMDHLPELGKDLTLRLISKSKSKQKMQKVPEMLVQCECGYIWGIPVNTYASNLFIFPSCGECELSLEHCSAIE